MKVKIELTDVDTNAKVLTNVYDMLEEYDSRYRDIRHTIMRSVVSITGSARGCITEQLREEM